MVEWLAANYGTILVGGLMLSVVGFILSQLIRNKLAGRHLCEYANGASCCGSCGHCNGGCGRCKAASGDGKGHGKVDHPERKRSCCH